MTHKNMFLCHTPSNSQGWILVYALVFLTLIQSAALITSSIIRYNYRSANVFNQIIRQSHTLSKSDVGPINTSSRLNQAPQGWDHLYFYTDLIDRTWGRQHTLSWQACLREQPYDRAEDMTFSFNTPYVLVIVDDSIYMDTSYYTHAVDLINNLDLCMVGVATTSKGLIQTYTVNKQLIRSTMESIKPVCPDAALSESLFTGLGTFPKKCAASRHVLITTSGTASDDGNLPEWLKDYDNDGDPNDIHIAGAGSHCLDDVAQYAAEKDIHVHTIGPDTALLKNTADNGNGVFLPYRDAIVPEIDFNCLMRINHGKVFHALKNVNSIFDYGWLAKDNASAFAVDATNPYTLLSLANLDIPGPVSSMYVNGHELLCSSRQGRLLKINLTAKEIVWSIDGLGGDITMGGDLIITGPDTQGRIFCLKQGPAVKWIRKGRFFDSSESKAYIAAGNNLECVDIQSGITCAQFNSPGPISSIRYDPCAGIVYAGTSTGSITALNQDLEIVDIMTAGFKDSIADIHPFTSLKRYYILCITRSEVACISDKGLVWSKSIDHGTPIKAIIMDSQAFITTWEDKAECTGIDAGTSYLIIMNALTGEMENNKTLCSGKAYGPMIDLENMVLEYINWKGTLITYDISSLTGVSPCPLGSRTDNP